MVGAAGGWVRLALMTGGVAAAVALLLGPRSGRRWSIVRKKGL